MTEKQQRHFVVNREVSEKIELDLLEALKVEEAYLNTILQPNKEVMNRSRRIKELLNLLG